MSIISDIVSGVISPITGVLNTWFNTKKDTTIAQGEQDVQTIQARADLAKAALSDPSTRFGHWLFIGGTGLWYLSIIYYCVLHHLVPSWTWVILALPENIQYIPYAVIAYLFVTAWRK